MNDYLNHKWRSFLTDVHKPERKRLHENKSSPKTQPVEATEKTKTIAYPRLRITDDFGTTKTKGRADAEMFFKQVTRKTGRASTMKMKIKAINEFLDPNISDEKIKNMPIERVLGTLVTLDVFSAIVHKFDPSGAGFLFEGFMAALFGGKGRQVKCNEPGCGIEDIWDFAGERVSLKLLSGGKLDGSIESLRNTIKDNNRKPIRYIFAKKVTEGKTKEVNSIEFYEFTLGTDGREWHWQTAKDKKDNTYSSMERMRSKPGADLLADLYVSLKNTPRAWETEEGQSGGDYQKVGTYWARGKHTGQTDQSQKNLQVIKEPITDRGEQMRKKTANVDPNRPGTWIRRTLRGDERTKVKANLSWAGGSTPRFEIPASIVAKSTKKGSPYFIGAIKMGSDEFLKEVAQKYADRLEGGISEIYNSLEVLTDSVNHFIMVGNNAESGEKAVKASQDLVTNTNCVVVQRECEFKKTER